MTLPAGLGVYLRDRYVMPPEGARWGHCLVNARRADRLDLAAQARAGGAQVWMYTTPEGWQLSSWRAELERVQRAAQDARADGIMANPESGWTGGAVQREGTALGQALAAASLERGVALTSYPAWAGLASTAAASGSAVSGQVQIYGRSAMDAETFARWYASWVAAWGEPRTGLAVAGWPSVPALEQRAGYARYLSMLPRPSSRSVSAWTAAGSAPAPWRLAELAAWYATGAGPATPLPGAPSAPGAPGAPGAPSAGRGGGMGVLALLALLAVLVSSRR